jgi:hypothetical protein
MLNGHIRESFEKVNRASGYINRLSLFCFKKPRQNNNLSPILTFLKLCIYTSIYIYIYKLIKIDTYPEDWGRIYFRNIGNITHIHTVYQLTKKLIITNYITSKPKLSFLMSAIFLNIFLLTQVI